ncbi:uncharacterized protein LOC134267249 [Saccostrea cucullata]|uniref:uncharacterized protein LOC134267249 n=1 Tax=Saccostrea cuccullata TaxID=36930 RepID=UPI002ED53E90
MECIWLFRLLVSIFLFCPNAWGGWSFWSDWTPCSYPCEGKTKWRRRHCMTQFCNGNYYESEYCRPQDCLPETKPPTVAFRQNFNNSYLTKETKRYVKSTVRERGNENVVILVSVPILTACGVLYTIAKIYKIIKNRQRKAKEARENTKEQCHSPPAIKISSTEEEKEVRKYDYVSYDDISKRSSSSNSSPSHSYVYDVTWN